MIVNMTILFIVTNCLNLTFYEQIFIVYINFKQEYILNHRYEWRIEISILISKDSKFGQRSASATFEGDSQGKDCFGEQKLKAIGKIRLTFQIESWN